MRILIAGIDGYLGWSLAKHLVLRNHEVLGYDYLSWNVKAEMSGIQLPSFTAQLRLIPE